MLRTAFDILSYSILRNVIGFSGLITLLVLPFSSSAQSMPGTITIDKGARIWIEGSAGPINFSCQAQELSGAGAINNTSNPQAAVQDSGEVQISVTLPVLSLDCGKSAMNTDMYNALRAQSYPNISYRVLDATLVDDAESGNWMNIHTRGIMEIAGVQDTTDVYVKGKAVGDRQFQVTGQKQIQMDTYNIEPPSKMFGLIRANKKLLVLFDVTVTLQNPAR